MFKSAQASKPLSLVMSSETPEDFVSRVTNLNNATIPNRPDLGAHEFDEGDAVLNMLGHNFLYHCAGPHVVHSNYWSSVIGDERGSKQAEPCIGIDVKLRYVAVVSNLFQVA